MKFIKRRDYYAKIKPFIGKHIIKVITGMRRSGKSYFMAEIIQELIESGVPEKNILYIDKESLDFDNLVDYKDLNSLVQEKLFNKNRSKLKQIKSKSKPTKKYLFVDEVQQIEEWERTIVSLYSQGDIDIFISGSNAKMLSSDLSTLLAGRYIEFPIYTLSFTEFLEFRNAYASKTLTSSENFDLFLRYGGLPAIHEYDFNASQIQDYSRAVLNTVIYKDLLLRNEIRNPDLLDRILRFVFDNVGSLVSAKKISDYFKSQKLKVGVEAVTNYLSYFEAAFLVYKTRRYDLKGKRFLEIAEKYYLSDLGLRHCLVKFFRNDISHLLENIVFLELKKRGYQICIGKSNGYEIDFIATKDSNHEYYQVCSNLNSAEVVEREFRPLLAVADQYPKYVLSLDE